jgi:EmrB/QacA subfamily drug resistance transporter
MTRSEGTFSGVDGPSPGSRVTPTKEVSERQFLSGITGLLVLVGVFLAILMGGMDALVVSTVLPSIASDLHQVNGVTFVVSSYLISSTISIPIFARISDILSRRNVFLVGLATFIAGSALAGLSQNLTELIVFRGVQGFGGGGVFPVAVAMVGVLYSPTVRTRATGVLSGAAGLSIVLGPLVGNYIVSVTTWRWVFYINLPFGLAAMAIVLFAIGPLRPAKVGGFDLPGAGLLSGWVGTLMFALVEVSDAGWTWSDPRTIGLLFGAVLLFAVFLWWELRTDQPLLPLRLFRHRVILAASGVMLFTGIVFSSAITFLSVFVGIILLHNGPGATSSVRDIIYFFAIPMILGATLAGQLLTRIPYRSVVAPGLLVAGAVGFLLTELTSSIPLWVLAGGFLPIGGIALPLIPMGLGLGLALAGTQIAILNEAPAPEVGAAVGLSRFLQSLGGALGISLLTVFQSWRYQVLSQSASTPVALGNAVVASYNEVFLIIALSILASFGFSLLLTGKVPAVPTAERRREARSPGETPPVRRPN